MLKFQLIGPRNCLGNEISNSPHAYRGPERGSIHVRKSAYSLTIMNFLGSSARIKLNTFRVNSMCYKFSKYSYKRNSSVRAIACIFYVYDKGIEKDNPLGLSFLVFTLDKADMARY